MNQQLALEQISDWFEPGRKKLQRMIDRSSRLRLLLLGLTHTTGCLIMLSPPATLILAASSAIYLSNHAQGPLDWFLVEVLTALSLFSAYLSYQLFKTRPQAPGGVAIRAGQAPELFSMLERRATHFHIRPINTLLLTPDAELNIQATPLWPVPFRHRYTLCIGAPLLFFMTPGQFRLALAGAVASTAHGQNSWTGRLARASEDWMLIQQALQNHPSQLLATLLLKPLATVIRFSDYLGRDVHTDSQQIQGRWIQENGEEKNASDYLSNHVVTGAFLEQQYWPMIYKAAERSPTPVVKPFAHFGLLLEKLLDVGTARRWLLQAQICNEKNNTALRELLAGLGIEHLQWPGLPADNAFHSIFTSTAILKSLDSYWQTSIEAEWTERHNRFRQDRQRFEKLRARAHQLRGTSALRYVQLATRFLDQDQAAEVCRDMYNANQGNANLCFTSGRELLIAGCTQEGCAALQRASELDSSLANRAHALINEHRQAKVEERGNVAFGRTG